MRPRTIVLLFIAFLLVSFFLYGNTIPGEFVFDDVYYYPRLELRDPAWLTKVWFEPLTNVEELEYAETYRPLVVFTMALNFILFGESTASFHILNIILNGTAIFLLFVVTQKLFGKFWLSLFTATLFAFLPIHTEAVAFVKAREELMATNMILLSWVFFLYGTSKKISYKYLILSSLFFFLACLSREFMLIFPVAFFIVYYFANKFRFGLAVKLAVPYVIAALAHIALWHNALGGKLPFKNLHSFAANPIAYVDLSDRVYTVFAILFGYVGKVFFPFNLTATYRYNHYPIAESLLDIRVILGLAIAVLLIAPFFVKRHKTLPLTVGSVIFLISYLPFSKLLFTGGEYMAERWLYFPSAGLCLIAAYGLFMLFNKNKRLALVILAAITLVYGFIIIPRNLVWRSQEALYKSMTVDAPNSMHGQVWLARHYAARGEFAKAYPYIQKALEIYPNYYQVQAVHSAWLFNQKRYSEAEKAIVKAISLKPEISTFYFYALILSKLGHYGESQDVIKTHLGSIIHKSDARFLSAVNYYKMGEIAKAMEYFDWNLKLSDEEKIQAINEF